MSKVKKEQTTERIHYKKPEWYLNEFHCPYCKRELTYVWIGNRLLGIGLDKWTYCSNCKKYFKIGIWGFREYKLDLKEKAICQK